MAEMTKQYSGPCSANSTQKNRKPSSVIRLRFSNILDDERLVAQVPRVVDLFGSPTVSVSSGARRRDPVDFWFGEIRLASCLLKISASAAAYARAPSGASPGRP